MNLFKKLLWVVLIAATAVMASAQAQVPNPDLGILSPAAQTKTDFGTSGSTFVDIFNFSIGADHHGFLGTAVGLAPDGTPTIGTISNLTLTLFAGSDATGATKGSVTSTNGSLIDLAGTLLAGNYSAKISGLVSGTLGGGYQFVVSANPEPAEWMLLLAGLMVVGFMARRRTSLLVAA